MISHTPPINPTQPWAQSPFHRTVDLASDRNNARVLAANDDFFAPKENLIKSASPQSIPGKYTDRGKWMDGWESRRRRTPGHDWCVVKLGYRGRIAGANVDTSHFNGNQPEKASLDGADVHDDRDPEEQDWKPILEPMPLAPDADNHFDVASDDAWTHVRLNIFPDGGVARLRVYGEVLPDWESLQSKSELELSSLSLGGRAIDCSGEHFGPVANLLHPSEPVNMGDGWETARRRGPGHDWAIVALGRPGILSSIEVDTTHFKGNYPESCLIEGANLSESGMVIPNLIRDRGGTERTSEIAWRPLIERTALQADHHHRFELVDAQGPVSHVRLNIYPDGGVARLRVFGRLPATNRDA